MTDSDEEGAFQSADEGEEAKVRTSSSAKASSEDPAMKSQTDGVVNIPSQESMDRGGEGPQTPKLPPPRPPPPAVTAAEKNKPAASGGGWGSWGSWGANMLSSASSSVSTSVSTFTSQVGEGFQTVLDTVESSLGAPDAEELAKQEKLADVAKEPDETPDGHPTQTVSEAEPVAAEEEARAPSEKAESIKSGKSTDSKLGEAKQEGGAGWWGGFSGITSIVKDTGKFVVQGGEKLLDGGLDMIEHTGKSLKSGSEKVIGGGLTVLETIGKKTYDVIAEGDHGVKEAIRNRPNLSQMLRDAKKKAEEKSQQDAEFEEVRKAHFGMLFDDYNGLVHLEALEAVANQCESRVQNMLTVLDGDQLEASKHELIIIKEIFQIEEFSDDEAEEPKVDEDHEFEQLATEHVGNLGLSVTATRLIEAHHKSRLWLKDCSDEQQQGVRINAKEIHQMAIQSLAELTAVSVEQFHKVAQQLLLRQEGPYSVFKSKATCLFNLVRVIGKEVDIVAVQFTHRLNKAAEDAEEPDSVNPFITNVYLEATNSKTYIQDAFQLLLPVLQQAALQANTES